MLYIFKNIYTQAGKCFNYKWPLHKFKIAYYSSRPNY